MQFLLGHVFIVNVFVRIIDKILNCGACRELAPIEVVDG